MSKSAKIFPFPVDLVKAQRALEEGTDKRSVFLDSASPVRRTAPGASCLHVRPFDRLPTIGAADSRGQTGHFTRGIFTRAA